MKKLLNIFGSPRNIFYMSKEEICAAKKIDKRTIAALSDKNLSQVKKVKKDCVKNGIKILTFESPYYPEMLKHISAPPYVLYTRSRSRIDLNQYMCIAMVGNRKSSNYGNAVAEDIAYGVSSNGFVVVSGMAEGIDSASHKGALLSGGITVAVAGRGLDDAYPRFNRQLMEEIIQTGMVISEYPPETEPKRQNFPERNRIISGICSGTVVVEAPKRSGSLITANYALEQNRDVFAIPGDITREKSEGTNNLIKEGAYPVTSARDIVEYYSYEYIEHSREKIHEEAEPKEKETLNNDTYSDLTDEEMHIVSKLSDTPINFDMLLAKTGMAPDKLATQITMLELKGKVKAHPGKNFTLNT